MKAKILLFILCSGIGFSGPALAAGSPFYLGLKAGRMMVDVSEFEDANSVGLVAGYKFFDGASGSLAVEGEYTNSSSADITVLGVTGKWDIDTLAVYLAYRSGGDLYLKGKIGYLDEEISASIAGFGISGSDSGLSVGIGGGWKIGANSALELEYTMIEEDVNFLSLGVNFSF
jgi:hypothetical protein